MSSSQLSTVRQDFDKSIEKATSLDELEALRIQFLGKKGQLTTVLKTLGTLEPKQRKEMGQAANVLKEEIVEAIEIKKEKLEKMQYADIENEEWIDLTKPVTDNFGSLHPLTQILETIEEIFTAIGFEIASGPEVEYDKYCFEMLNMPKHHPARDTQDTFYFSPEVLLRTQTSSVQIRHMIKHDPPIRIIVPGKVYRRDYDLTHTPMFHQFEGLVVGPNITIADLMGTAQYAMQKLLGDDVEVRFRPHHFPYTEPSLEVDVSCTLCKGQGCRSCKYTGWLEMAGAGMVHGQVFSNVGYNPDEISGFAFGFGIERIVMMRHKINDIRLLFENDRRFLSQF